MHGLILTVVFLTMIQRDPYNLFVHVYGLLELLQLHQDVAFRLLQNKHFLSPQVHPEFLGHFFESMEQLLHPVLNCHILCN